MKKSMFAVLMAFSVISTAVPMEDLEEQGCIEVYENIATEFMQQHEYSDILLAWEATVGVQGLDYEAMELCSLVDLVPGAYDVLRTAEFCLPEGEVVELFTKGDFWCSDEGVVGIKGLHAAP